MRADEEEAVDRARRTEIIADVTGLAGGAALGIAATILWGFVGLVGFTTVFAVGQPLGVVAVRDEMGWLEVVGWSALAGGFWGALTGVVPGLVAGPAVRLAAGH